MPWEVSEEEERAVLHQTANKQYEYFVHKVADWEEVWLLRRGESEYGLLEGDPREDDRATSLAVWPHPRYAELCLEGGLWEGYEVASMDVHEFVDGMLGSLLEAGRDVGVLPMPDGRSTPVSPRRLRSDLDEELTKYGE